VKLKRPREVFDLFFIPDGFGDGGGYAKTRPRPIAMSTYLQIHMFLPSRT